MWRCHVRDPGHSHNSSDGAMKNDIDLMTEITMTMTQGPNDMTNFSLMEGESYPSLGTFNSCHALTWATVMTCPTSHMTYAPLLLFSSSCYQLFPAHSLINHIMRQMTRWMTPEYMKILTDSLIDYTQAHSKERTHIVKEIKAKIRELAAHNQKSPPDDLNTVN